MKILVILSILLFTVSCGRSGPQEIKNGTVAASHIIIPQEKQLQLTWFSGAGQERYYSFGRDREIVIPANASVMVDSSKEVRSGAELIIIFSSSRCEYVFNGTHFAFSGCDGQLAAYIPGDVFTLNEIGATAGYPVIIKLGIKVEGDVNISATLQKVRAGNWKAPRLGDGDKVYWEM